MARPVRWLYEQPDGRVAVRPADLMSLGAATYAETARNVVVECDDGRLQLVRTRSPNKPSSVWLGPEAVLVLAAKEAAGLFYVIKDDWEERRKELEELCPPKSTKKRRSPK